MRRKISCFVMAAMIVMMMSGCNNEETEILGKVTSVNDKEITLALGTEDTSADNKEKPQMPDGNQDDKSQPDKDSEKPSDAQGQQQNSQDNKGQSGDNSGTPQQPSGKDNNSTPPDMPQNNGDSSGKPSDNNGGGQGNPPEMPGQMGDGYISLNLTGEEKTIKIKDSTPISIEKDGETTDGSLSDIVEDSVISVKMKGDKVVSITVKKSSSMGGPGGGDMSGSSTGSIELNGTLTADGDSEECDNKNIDSSEQNQNAVLVKNGGSMNISNSSLSKTGDTTSEDESNFYGVNAILAAASGSTVTIKDTKLTSDSEGSNAIFSTGEGSNVQADNVTIYTKGNSSRGLDATYGGTITANNVNITTEGAHCAAIATDRGEGTITVTGGKLSCKGDGSPCVYSTGNITVNDVTGTATGSQAAVVEGKNSITLNGCSLTGAGLNGIMLYQSTSGDAGEGTAEFKATDSTIKTTSSGPMFYITNTNAEAVLTNTSLDFDSGILVNIAGNSTNNWGTPGSNGGNLKLTAINQILKGDIKCDEISTGDIELTESSSLESAVNADNTAKSITISLDDSSKWIVTGDSYVSAITDSMSDCSNIISNGYTIYYDSSNSDNSWLDGKTITLQDGGKIAPNK